MLNRKYNGGIVCLMPLFSLLAKCFEFKDSICSL